MQNQTRVNTINLRLKNSKVPLRVKYSDGDIATVIDRKNKPLFVGDIDHVETYISGAIGMYHAMTSDFWSLDD